MEKRFHLLAIFAFITVLLSPADASFPDRPRNRVMIKTGLFHYDLDNRLSKKFDRLAMDEWELAQEIEYERNIFHWWSVSAAFSFNGDIQAAIPYALIYPAARITKMKSKIPIRDLWDVNYTHGRYWVDLRHYGILASTMMYPVSVSFGAGDSGLFEVGIGAGGGAYWLQKKIRSRTGSEGSIAGNNVWTVKPGAFATARVRLSGGMFGVSIEYRFQYVPAVSADMPLGYDYNVSGSVIQLTLSVGF